MSIIVSGFAPDDAVPGSYRASVFGAGLVNIGALPTKVLCLGNKTSSGSATADLDVLPIGSESEADGLLGTGSECADTCYGALSVGSGISVYAAPVAEPSAGPVASSITIAFSGTPTRNGTLRFRCGGKAFNVGVSTTDTPTNVGTNTNIAANAVIRGRFTSGVVTTTVTLTNRNTGARGNQLLLWWDSSDVPGLTVTVTGGTAIHANLVPFTSGAGTDSVANVLALLTGETYDFIASPHNDATNMGLIKAQLATEALPGVSHLEQAIFAIFGTYAAAQSLSTSTLNDVRCTLVWSTYLENGPAWYAGKVAAMRAAIVGQQPNFKWAANDNCRIVGAQAHAYKGDNPGHSSQKNALNNGLCVLRSEGADVYIVRGIVTKCLTSSNPDFRTRDWADVDVTDRINREIGALWTATSTANMWSEPNSITQQQPGPGVITPASWNAILLTAMQDFAARGWVYLVTEHPPQSEWDNDRKCIMSAIPVYVKPKSFQLGANINQTAA